MNNRLYLAGNWLLAEISGNLKGGLINYIRIIHNIHELYTISKSKFTKHMNYSCKLYLERILLDRILLYSIKIQYSAQVYYAVYLAKKEMHVGALLLKNSNEKIAVSYISTPRM